MSTTGAGQRDMPSEGSASNLLDRLESVRETGSSRWLARCPAHDDKHPSLSIRDVGDRLLIHCFTGCEPIDVVHAAGLELRDLFANNSPTDGRQSPRRSSPPASDVLVALSGEILVASLICGDVLDGKTIDKETWERLAKACAIIGKARDQYAPARVGK
jgi:hypothetical protein